MTVDKKNLSQTSAPTNVCPDLRRGLVAAGANPEKKYPWMVLGQISPKYEGDCSVLLVAPHGFPGDDDNTEILACFLAEKLNSYAVVNNRKYDRKTNSDDNEFWQDLNVPSEAVECDDFWGPLMECTEQILQNYTKPPLILFIHGIGNDNADEYLGKEVDFALGAGYEGSYNAETATASGKLITKLRDAITKKFRKARDGVPGYGATGKVPILFRKGVQNEKVSFRKRFPDAQVEAIQLEIRCRGYRDSIENIEKLVKGLKEILTDTTEQGFQDYFTRERKTLDGITIDAEFKSFVPRLSAEEYQQLEENIVRSGMCHDPLRVWRHEGKLILLDGHHRREICHKHGLPNPMTVEVELGNRAEAIKWITDHQLGRRNLNRFQRFELVYRREPFVRELAKARQKDGHKLRGKGAETKGEVPLHTDETLGEDARISAKTYQKARDIIKYGPEDLIRSCREGEIAIDAAFKQIEKPRKEKTVKKAVKTTGPGIQSQPPPKSPPASQAAPRGDAPLAPPDLPSPCDVIVANVPWELALVTLEKLAALPVPNMAHENCMLWLRATNSRILEAYELVKAWGFQPETLFTWIKQEAEPGKWLKDRSEHYVLGVKGNPTVDEERKFSTASETGAAKDNPKRPMQFYRQIELYCSGKTRLDVFSETPREGWIRWNPWPVDKQAEGMMREKAAPETQGEGSKKESAKSIKKGSKSKPTSKKKIPHKND
jgi:N6-adenosine-specific RNA methylase IME4